MEWTRKTRLFNEITTMLRGVESRFEMGGQDQKSFLLVVKSWLACPIFIRASQKVGGQLPTQF